MSPFFTVAEILAAVQGTLLQGGATTVFAGVSTDSRTCQSGQLFLPLTGERHDGHTFIPKAIHRGARGVLVEERVVRGTRAENSDAPPIPYMGWLKKPASDGLRLHPKSGLIQVPPEVTVMAVTDTLKALGDLAQAWRKNFDLPVVAITGSCGKTTAKEMTAKVLSQAYRVLKNEMNLNNLIGLPQTLLGLDGAYEAAVVELGMNRFGEIRRLVDICRPTVGVLLNVYPAHTEGVGCVEGVARAKGELIDGLGEDAWLVFNADDERIRRRALAFPGRALGFGFRPEAHLKVVARESRGRDGQSAQVTWQGLTWELQLAAPGEHQLYNALAATAVGLCLGVPPTAAAAALADFQPIARRSQITVLPSGVHLLNDCYNANPGSMAMALKTLMELKGHGRTAAALGDMLELGEHAAREHRQLGRLAARMGLDFLIVYGEFREEVAAGAREAGLHPDRLRCVSRHADGARLAQEWLRPGDWLLVKGSRGMHMENLIANL